MSHSALSATVVGIDQSIDSLNLKEFDYVEEVKIDEEKSARKERIPSDIIDQFYREKDLSGDIRRGLFSEDRYYSENLKQEINLTRAKEFLKKWANNQFGNQEKNIQFKGVLLGMSKGGIDKLTI